MTRPAKPIDGRRKRSDLRAAADDRLAADLLGVTHEIAMHQLTWTPPTGTLNTCAACGSLERDDRACQVCLIRRRRSAA